MIWSIFAAHDGFAHGDNRVGRYVSGHERIDRSLKSWVSHLPRNRDGRRNRQAEVGASWLGSRSVIWAAK